MEKNQSLSMRGYAFLLILVFALTLLTACTNENNKNNGENNTPTSQGENKTDKDDDNEGKDTKASQKKLFDAEEIAKNLNVKQYSFSDSRKSHVFLVVENTSEYTLVINASITALDSSGNPLGAKDSGDNDVPPGQKTLLGASFDDKFDKIEYEFSVAEERLYKPVTQDLSYKSTTATKKEVVTITNNGENDAEFVQGHMLFFKGDTLVWYDMSYFTDVDSQIKAGKSLSKELTCSQAYDSTIFVITGRSK